MISSKQGKKIEYFILKRVNICGLLKVIRHKNNLTAEKEIFLYLHSIFSITFKFITENYFLNAFLEEI